MMEEEGLRWDTPGNQGFLQCVLLWQQFEKTPVSWWGFSCLKVIETSSNYQTIIEPD